MKKGFLKIAGVLLVFVLLSMTFVGCSGTDKDEGQPASGQDKQEPPKAKDTEKELSRLEQIKKAGKIVVGTSADYPPYEFHLLKDGKDEIVGFDIEIAKEIAKELGVELEIKDMKFEGLLAALQAGNVDFVIAGMTPDEDRKQSVDFTDVYYRATQNLMIRVEDKDKIKSVEDLKGKKVGAQKGAIQEKIVTEQIPGSELKPLGKIADLILQLKSKKIDALVVEGPVAKAYVQKHDDLMITDIQFKTDENGSAIAVKKGSPELVDAMNKVLKRLQDENLIEKYVGEANQLADELLKE